MRIDSALASAPTTSPPPPMPITSGRRAARRIASASLDTARGDSDRGVQLIVLAQYPPPLVLTHDPLGPRLRGGPVLDLGIDLLGIGAGQQLLLQRLPVRGVVDMAG